MPFVTVTGNLGRDASFKTTQGGAQLCSFPVADEAGYGDNKQTLWFDVANWGKGSEGLARILRKGSKVTVVGELTTREHEGKTYLQVNAASVKIMSTPQGGGQGGTGGAEPAPANYDDIDDDIPFLTSDGMF